MDLALHLSAKSLANHSHVISNINASVTTEIVTDCNAAKHFA
jgi:hypothetical protein